MEAPGAGGGLIEGVQKPKKRRLARPTGPDDRQYLARLHLHADVAYQNPTDEGAGEMLGLKRNGLRLQACGRAQSCFSRFWVAHESGRPCDSCCRHVFASLSIVPFALAKESSGGTISMILAAS